MILVTVFIMVPSCLLLYQNYIHSRALLEHIGLALETLLEYQMGFALFTCRVHTGQWDGE